MRKLVTNCINNLKLKNKLLVIYCVCVFLPIILCNLIFYVNISQNLIRHEKERINISMERIGETLIQSMQEVISVSNIIYNDPKLNSDLEKEYVDFIEFSDEYNNNLKYSVSKYYAIYEQIKEITIYTDNPTIVEASGYYSLGDEVKESDWYRNYVESKKNIIVYFDKNTGEINVIRKLNNFKDSSHYQKYLKIVLRKESINSIMYREKLKGNLKLFNNLGDTVSCSNFTIYDNKDQNRILKLSKNFDDSKYLKGWKIEGEFAYHIIISEISGSRDYIINIMVICLVIATIIIAIISKSLSSRIKIIIKHMNLVQKNEYVSIIMEESKDEIGELINEFNHMVMIIKKLIRDEYVLRINKQKLEIEMKQSQINALQSQMNPHFLFNSFESIKMRCLIKDEVETAEIIQALSKNFRRMISWNDDMVSVESEIEYIEDFIKIQKYRFKDKVHYEINVDSTCMRCMIPKMTIQPLVENAVEHGVSKKRGKGNVYVNIEHKEEFLICKVTDDGIGMNEEKLQQLRDSLETDESNCNSIGVKNVYKRLKLIYGSTDFKIDSKLNAGTVISFRALIK